MQINAYLTFNGNCRQAMTFYQKCLGGKLTFQTIGESPKASGLPPKLKKFILTGTLINEYLLLVGTDMVSEEGLIRGNTVSLLLNCNGEIEIKQLHKKLSAGGIQKQPLAVNYYGIKMSYITDRYGNNWVLQQRESGN